mmetsp:Transcript_134266/g.374239  ORF Transcript_134266/g.374239 Transcript_134266/m.374239 type:complete len:243 (-) Transcript_134266:303-1031(-)
MPSRTSFTISAFCMGLTRHAMRTEHDSATSRNSRFLRSLSRMPASASPVTIRACLRPPLSSNLAAASASVVPSFLSTVWMFISSVSTFVLKPMLRAVSSLSPVSTQSLIPASRNFTMVSGTSSCSLSSMAVAPRISIGLSISSATAASCSSRSRVARLAASWRCCHAETSLPLSLRQPITRVRRPSLENSLRSCSNFLCSLCALSSITLSAPFTKSMYSESRWTTTDMRFRVDVNSLVASTV